MASMEEIICGCGCGRKKMVRTADVKRGWGIFFSKSCKARHQEGRTGQNAAYRKTMEEIELEKDHDYAMAECEMGWDAHKDSF